MPPPRSEERKYHIFGQYWYTRNVPVFTNTGMFQYLGSEVHLFPQKQTNKRQQQRNKQKQNKKQTNKQTNKQKKIELEKWLSQEFQDQSLKLALLFQRGGGDKNISSWIGGHTNFFWLIGVNKNIAGVFSDICDPYSKENL